MMKVIITGANGFIGKHLIKKLLSENMEIFAVVRTKPETEAECIGKIHWIEGDLYEDPGIVIETLKEYGAENADCFYHLAWNGVAACEKNDSKVQMTNITISMNAISVCKNVYCKRFVYPGSVSEYAGLDGIIHEKSIPSPADIYGAVKTAVRNLITMKAILEQIDILNVILCSIYGEGRCDDNVISYTIKKLLRGESPQYGNLQQMWDFLHVDDAANALFLIGSGIREWGGAGARTYTVGSGVYRHLYEYIETIHNMINPQLPLGIGILGNKYENVLSSCVNTFQLQKDTGFLPKMSFEEGILRTITYFRENMSYET